MLSAPGKFYALKIFSTFPAKMSKFPTFDGLLRGTPKLNHLEQVSHVHAGGCQLPDQSSIVSKFLRRGSE